MTMYGSMERLLKRRFARTHNGNWLISVGCVNYFYTLCLLDELYKLG